jgi:hypothetical protein
VSRELFPNRLRIPGGIDGNRGELEWDRPAHGPSVPDLYSRLKCSQ